MIPSILTSYTDRLSYFPGEAIHLFVSSPQEDRARVSLVHLDAALDSPGKEAQTTEVPWADATTVPVGGQDGHFGGFMTGVLAAAPGTRFTVGAFVRFDERIGPSLQAVVAVGDEQRAVVLGVEDARLVLRSPDGAVRCTEPLDPNAWYLLVGTVDGDRAEVHALAVEVGAATASATGSLPGAAPLGTDVVVAGAFPVVTRGSGATAHGRAAANLTATVSWPFVTSTVLDPEQLRALAQQRALDAAAFGDGLLGAWDLFPGDGEDGLARSATGGEPGRLHNLPTRAVPGPNWQRRTTRFVEAPAEYSAAHFHATDLVDAGWSETFSGALPADLPSGAYALRVATERETDVVPFVVAPAPADARKPVVVVIPTFTYLSYANESLFEGMVPSVTGHFTTGPSEADLAHVGNRTFGLSQYDTHADGHGVVFSSAARPIVNTRHDYRMWLSDSGRGFSAEMYLLEWLATVGIAFDVITDFELHTLGADYLAGWEVVLSGAHPEYHSSEMLDALTRYRDTGGHLVYLGGNGFYWVTGVVSESPLVLEVRRGFAGITAWKSRPGETCLVSTGLLGGSWRHRGREPQRLVGVGMAGQGWGGSQPYWRTEASYAPEVAWIFEGVEEEPIGAYGRVMGGAAGDELDRADPVLGTPADAVVLAASRDHDRTYQRDAAEVAFILDGQHGGDVDPEVHSDVVHFTTPGGGAVFAAGSIAYSGALLENGAKNGISRMTENVVRRFAGLDTTEGSSA
ncbi:N,N-dimethylformamidase beta subunit family domain-containing protein [Pseudonocardia broussonetiae]|uniref:N,N-dimethylformamidase beta subunit-like C-terminal domain-containing protein n=1 Tax=Pseudonocardia broussonetiae TaxID=2736640 RepID=A0A6M6JMU4_9PSEU|nr:N,N-dimethylformamidase beta subunit family domain-containing protein [Pseudonocardia broussonetiae]QJY47749.1 hypothetical protein HOP40_19645 [Pseudonocardia broussonetiae]